MGAEGAFEGTHQLVADLIGRHPFADGGDDARRLHAEFRAVIGALQSLGGQHAKDLQHVLEVERSGLDLDFDFARGGSDPGGLLEAQALEAVLGSPRQAEGLYGGGGDGACLGFAILLAESGRRNEPLHTPLITPQRDLSFGIVAEDLPSEETAIPSRGSTSTAVHLRLGFSPAMVRARPISAACAIFTVCAPGKGCASDVTTNSLGEASPAS